MGGRGSFFHCSLSTPLRAARGFPHNLAFFKEAEMSHVCFLSGLEIPPGRFSLDHLYPRSLIPKNFHSCKQNIFPAHKVLNSIKSNMLPCRWEEKKYDRVYFAIQHYKMKPIDRDFLIRTLANWETYKIDACTWCIMQQKCQGRQK